MASYAVVQTAVGVPPLPELEPFLEEEIRQRFPGHTVHMLHDARKLKSGDNHLTPFVLRATVELPCSRWLKFGVGVSDYDLRVQRRVPSFDHLYVKTTPSRINEVVGLVTEAAERWHAAPLLNASMPPMPCRPPPVPPPPELFFDEGSGRLWESGDAGEWDWVDADVYSDPVNGMRWALVCSGCHRGASLWLPPEQNE